MKKIGKGSMSVRLTALLLALWMIACAFAGCAQTPVDPEDSESDSITLDAETESVGETESETEADSAVTYTYDLNRIHIVRPKARNTQMDNAVAVLSEALMDAGVDGFEVGDDYELTEDPSRLEILIGDTNQPLSAEAKKHLKSGEEFIVAFYENKIVIQVMENENLEFAVGRFSEILAAKTQGGVLTVSKSDTVIAKGDFIVLELVKDKKPVFNVVIPGMATEVEQQIASRVVAKIEKYTGVAAELTYDDMTPYKEDMYSILIGNVKYPEVETVLSELSRSQYGVRYVGNKIVVAGHVTGTLSLAGEMLLDKMDLYGSIDKKTVNLHMTDDWIGEETAVNLDYPECKYGALRVDIDDENNTLMFSYTGVKSDQYEAYRKEVEGCGYTLWQDNQIGDNLFATYRNGVGEIHLSYYPGEKSGTLHIFTVRFNETSPIPDAEPYEKVTEATLHVMSLDYTHRTIYDGHGMNYVITLEDGRYIVMDGGYNASYGSKDDRRIYEYLVENNKRPDGEIVIAAWFMSHGHGDHFGAFESFVTKYATQVTIEYFIANSYPTSMTEPAGGTHWMKSDLPKYLGLTGAKLLKPHTGQIITFCNTELEVMYTHENLYPDKMYDTNNSSTVLRMHQNGRTVLFSGDASVAACNKMVKIYGDELKSDVFQVNHHGCSGGTWEYYDASTSADSYVLWTCAKETFYYRTLGYRVADKTVAQDNILKPNRDLALKVGFSKCFYADGVVEQIQFSQTDGIIFVGEKDNTQDPTTQPMP